MADLLIDLQQGAAQLLKPAEFGDFTVGFALRNCRGKGFGDGFAFAFVSETVIGSMAGVVGLMTVTTGIPTTTTSSGDGTGAEITQAGNLIKQGLPLGFQCRQRIGHKTGCLLLAYHIR